MEFYSRIFMSKKLGFALSGLMLAMVAGTASADMDGGQLNISGLVVDNTCETRVDGGNKDGLILLQTATVGETDAGVLNDTVGAKAKPFSITVDCSKANPNPGSTAKMTFGSVFFGVEFYSKYHFQFEVSLILECHFYVLVKITKAVSKEVHSSNILGITLHANLKAYEVPLINP